MSEAPPVAVVGGRYRLTTCIGQGGMGTVWHAHHTSLRTPVAVKLLDPQLAKQDGLRSRFVREARAAAALHGDDVVRILDHGEEEGVPYIVMEYLEGESLGERLSREGVITPDFAGHVFSAVFRAVARAHKVGIIHRDLKPDNIFLVRGEAQLPHVKVLDFGIAKVLADANSLAGSAAPTATGSTMGTPYYMGPEQVRARKDVDQRADLWSLAVIAYECLTGKRPFDGESMGDLVMKICHEPVPVPSRVAPVPTGFDAWFAKATLRPLEERFQTVQEMAAPLAEVLTPGRPWFDDRASSVSLPTATSVFSPTEPALPADPRASTQRTSTKSVRPTEEGPTSARRVALAAVATVAVMSGAFAVYMTTRAAPSPQAATREAVSAAPSSTASDAVARTTPPTTTIEPVAAASSSAAASASSSAVASASSAPTAAASSGAPAGLPHTPPRLPSTTPPVAASAKPKPSTGFVGVD